tara:strand:+ start:3509 stop:5320 length:1812 start_codon:yes stop_codon:yes gene_type:complete
MLLIRVLSVCLVLHTLAGSLFAQTEVINETYPKFENSSVKIEAVFTPSAQQGAVPLLVTIRNNTGKDRIWTIKLTEGGSNRQLSTEIVDSIEVANGSEVKREMVMPIAPSFTTHSYRYLNTHVSSPGLPSHSRSSGHQANQNYPTLAISKQLARRSLTDLNDYLKNRSSSDTRFAQSFNPEQLPTGWKSYTALDGLLIDVESWAEINKSQRRGILEWVRLGGRLDIFAPENKKSGSKLTIHDLGIAGIQAVKSSKQVGRLSLGQVNIEYWNGDQLQQKVADSFDRAPHRAEELEDLFGQDWPLKKEFGDKVFNAALILFPLLIFAIFVAPVNLFYFAGKGKRHRLFITTPLISLAACILIVIIIFLEDGMGGRGIRATLADIQSHPREMRLYLSQEQISRTGVMVNPGFTSSSSFGLDSVNLPKSVFNPLSKYSNRNTTFRFIGNDYKGGFFRSRSEQAFSLRSVLPTRARIELTSSSGSTEPPVLVSSLPVPVSDVYFRDGTGKVWRSTPEVSIAPGSPIPLEATASPELSKWLTLQSTPFSKAQRKRIQSMGSEANRYFALPTSSAPFMINTHSAIRWEKEYTLLTGQVTSQNPPPAASNE